MRNILIKIIALLLLLPSLATASESSEKLTLTGFFTLNASVVDENNVQFSSVDNKQKDFEKNKLSFDHSVLGIQADLEIFNRLSLGLQAISTRQTDNHYQAEFEWAYLKYDFGHDLYARAGRLKLPFLQGTELRYVSYSRLWARPLVPSSGAGGFDDYDGAELYYNTYTDDYDLHFQISHGKPQHHLDFIESDNITLISAQAEKENSWLRASLLKTTFDAYTPTRRRGNLF